MEENARAHTGEHILFQALSRVYTGIKAQKVLITENRRSLFCEYEEELDWEGLYEAEKIANRIIREDRPVKKIFGTREEIEEMFPHIRAKWERIEDEEVCAVEVEGFDVAACSGEHVERTGEIGFIFITRVTRKGGIYEVEFEVSEDALHAALQYAFYGRRLASLAGTSIEKTYETFLNLKEKNTALEKRLQKMSENIMKTVTPLILNGIQIYATTFSGVDRKILADMAGLLIKQERCVVLFANEEEERSFFILARSKDVGIDVSLLLTEVLSRHDGRGGGRHEFAQGSARGEAYGVLLEEVREALERFK
jgi:alanyl-tRNA synthetase